MQDHLGRFFMVCTCIHEFPLVDFQVQPSTHCCQCSSSTPPLEAFSHMKLRPPGATSRQLLKFQVCVHMTTPPWLPLGSLFHGAIRRLICGHGGSSEIVDWLGSSPCFMWYVAHTELYRTFSFSTLSSSVTVVWTRCYVRQCGIAIQLAGDMYGHAASATALPSSSHVVSNHHTSYTLSNVPSVWP